MLSPIFSRSHRIPWAHDVPQTPTNTERMQAYRALAPVQFYNTVSNPRRQSEAAASRGALADGDFSTEARATCARVNRGGSDLEIHCPPPASTHSPLKDEQPRRAALPIPGTNTHTPGA